MKRGTIGRAVTSGVLIAASLTGCYSYTPVGVEAVAPGESVRARITPEATGKLPETIAADEWRVEGEFLERDGGGFTLFVPTTVVRQGFFEQDLHERVRLSPGDVIELERRELDRSRTYVMAGVAAAAVVGIVVKTLTGKTGGNTIDRTDQGPAASLIQLFSIRSP